MTDESRARADYRAIKGMQEYARHQIEVAFEKGFAQCDKQLQEACDNARREGYGEGLNAAWDCARKIIPLWEKGNTEDIFGTRDIETIFKSYFASDAISKIKEYEEKQAEAEIEVGDEVTISSSRDTLIVVTVCKNQDSVRVANRFGTTVWVDTCCAKKTGRHFPQVAEVFAQLKGVE